MAAFRIRDDAFTWLSEVQRTLPGGSIFDLYYFCAVAGLVTGRSSDINSGVPTREMVDYFVNDYKPAQSFLLAMLVVAEMKKSRIELAEEDEVRDLFRELVGGNSDSYLRDEGTRRLNAYASGGYEYLSGKMEQKPQSSEEFLRAFADLVGAGVADGPFI